MVVSVVDEGMMVRRRRRKEDRDWKLGSSRRREVFDDDDGERRVERGNSFRMFGPRWNHPGVLWTDLTEIMTYRMWVHCL